MAIKEIDKIIQITPNGDEPPEFKQTLVYECPNVAGTFATISAIVLSNQTGQNGSFFVYVVHDYTPGEDPETDPPAFGVHIQLSFESLAEHTETIKGPGVTLSPGHSIWALFVPAGTGYYEGAKVSLHGVEKDDAAPGEGGGGTVAWDDVTEKPETFPPSPHSHTFSSLSGIPDEFPPEAHGHAQSDIIDLVTDLAGKQSTSEKGAASGYASLDAGIKVPQAQLRNPVKAGYVHNLTVTNSDVDVTSVSLTLDVDDIVVFEFIGRLVNVSGSSVTYTAKISVGSESLSLVGSAALANNTSVPVYIRGVLGIGSTSVGTFGLHGVLNPAAASGASVSTTSRGSHQTFTSTDLTGPQTVAIKFVSNVAGNSNLYGVFRIEHFPAI